jgi:hypothetical protein
MAAATFDDVITRLREEGNLNRNSGSNSLKSLKSAVLQTDKTFRDGFGQLLDFFQGNSLKDLEAKREQDEFNKDLLDALEDLKGGDTPTSAPAPTDSGGGGLPLLLAGLAAAIGAAIGVVKGQLDAIKAFKLIPNLDDFKAKLSSNIKGMRLGIAMQMELFKASVAESLTSAKNALKSGITRIGSIFTLGDEGKDVSRIGSVIKSFTGYIRGLIVPFEEAGKVIVSIGESIANKLRPAINAVQGGFSTVGTYLDDFKAIVSRVSAVVGKLFAPIAIIMTLFDTVKGAIDGYAEGGILGGLEGAIVGFFTSLVTKPLDLVKSAVAWVLEKFGFENAANVLSSFSFTELFTNMINGIFGFFKSVINWVKQLFTDPVAALQALWDNLLSGYDSLMSFFSSIISAPINWIMDMFGWGDPEKPFDLWEFVKGIPGRIWNWITGMFTLSDEQLEGLSGAMDMVKKFTQKILRYILPDPDGDYGWADPRKYLVNFIPSSIYEYAGLDPYTGDAMGEMGIDGPSEGGSAIQSGLELQNVSAEQSALNDARDRYMNVIGGSTNVQTVNNNQTTIEPSPGPALPPEDELNTFANSRRRRRRG